MPKIPSNRMGTVAWKPGYMWKAYIESNHKQVAKGKLIQQWGLVAGES